MPKRSFNDHNWQNDPWFRALCTALSSCKTPQETASFLRDIGTLSELRSWSERLEVAKQLSQGFTYRQVAKNTGASTTTVTRVAKFLENGEGGYQSFLEKRKRKDEITEITKKTIPIQPSALQKYLNK